MQFNSINTKLPELIEFAKLLKENGFTVFGYSYTNNPETNYFSFTDGKGFAYVQYESLGGSFSFSNQHISSRNIGSSFGIETNGQLTLENALKAVNCNCPHWVTSNDRQQLRLYKDISQFLEYNKNCFILE